MSPFVARAATRAATRVAGQRQFSIVSNLRKVARGFEPHPFQRVPVTSNSQAGDWGKIGRRLGGQVVVYFPLLGALLGWPYAAKLLLDGRV